MAHCGMQADGFPSRLVFPSPVEGPTPSVPLACECKRTKPQRTDSAVAHILARRVYYHEIRLLFEDCETCI